MATASKIILLLITLLMPTALFAGQAERVGDKFRLTTDNLAAPFVTPSVAQGAVRTNSDQTGRLALPPGFSVTPFYRGLRHARWLYVLANGDVLVAESRAGQITLLRDHDGDGRADKARSLLDGLDRPHGLGYLDGWLYFAEPGRVSRARYDMAKAVISGPVQKLTAPGALGDGGGHWTRNIIFSKDGSKLYITVGSASNISEEPAPRATVQELDLASGKLSTFASGLRNPVGIARHPETDRIYVVVNERDSYGDQLVPDFFTGIDKGDFFGWPYAYAGNHPDPDYGRNNGERIAKSKIPDILIQAHSAPLGLVFYTGASFPADYRSDAFVALHGSWNSSRPTGYKLVRIRFKNGKSQAGYENFALGFRIGGTDRARVWGRPVGLAVAKDGALLVADDVSQSVWRINYE